MAVTVDVQSNPVFGEYNDAGTTVLSGVGTPEADCTVITSGYTTGTVRYIVARYDTWDGTVAHIEAGEVAPEDYLEFTSNETYDTDLIPQLVSISATELKVILKNRTNYGVVVSHNSGAWSDVVIFKTRDKKYSTPDAITQLTSDIELTDAGATVTVTNAAKATVTETAKGATVVNDDTVTVTATSKGATVVV